MDSMHTALHIRESSYNGAALDAARATTTEGRGKRVVNVLLRVEPDHEGRHIDNLTTNTAKRTLLMTSRQTTGQPSTHIVENIHRVPIVSLSSMVPQNFLEFTTIKESLQCEGLIIGTLSVIHSQREGRGVQKLI